MASQDDTREKAQMEIFGLMEFSETNRSNKYEPDSKKIIAGREITNEQKTKPELYLKKNKKTGIYEPKRKTSISTARGFDPNKAAEWKAKTNVFTFSEFKGYDYDDTWNEHYVGTYADLEPWIEEKVIKPFYEGRKPRKNTDGYYGMGEYEKNILPVILKHCNLSEADLKRIRHTMEVGNALNDPKIPWNYIKKNFTKVKNEKEFDDYCLSLINKGLI